MPPPVEWLHHCKLQYPIGTAVPMVSAGETDKVLSKDYLNTVSKREMMEKDRLADCSRRTTAQRLNREVRS